MECFSRLESRWVACPLLSPPGKRRKISAGNRQTTNSRLGLVLHLASLAVAQVLAGLISKVTLLVMYFIVFVCCVDFVAGIWAGEAQTNADFKIDSTPRRIGGEPF